MLDNINESNIKIGMKLNEFKMFAFLKFFKLLGEENQNNSFKHFLFFFMFPSFLKSHAPMVEDSHARTLQDS